MSEIKKGDIVTCKSCAKKIFFKIVDLYIDDNNQNIATLKGLDLRLCTNDLTDNLVPVKSEEVVDYWQNTMQEKDKQVKKILNSRTK